MRKDSPAVHPPARTTNLYAPAGLPSCSHPLTRPGHRPAALPRRAVQDNRHAGGPARVPPRSAPGFGPSHSAAPAPGLHWQPVPTQAPRGRGQGPPGGLVAPWPRRLRGAAVGSRPLSPCLLPRGVLGPGNPPHVDRPLQGLKISTRSRPVVRDLPGGPLRAGQRRSGPPAAAGLPTIDDRHLRGGPAGGELRADGLEIQQTRGSAGGASLEDAPG